MNRPSRKPVLADYAERAEATLDRLLPAADTNPERLHEAMRYAALNGGKRVRAMLVYAAGTTAGASLQDLDAPAAAVEMIHAYSLIHDDLPAMDDDDLRRGRPSCHRAFDEATAILAGDALQSRAFEVLVSGASSLPWEQRARMVAVLAGAVGSTGMVGGQILDMAGEHRCLGLDDLGAIHSAKTGALITAAVVLGGLGAPGASAAVDTAYHAFGREMGTAFQIVDDILDETSDTRTLGKRAGSDREAGKSTYPAAIGLDQSRRLAREHWQAALQALNDSGIQSETLRDIAELILNRPA